MTSAIDQAIAAAAAAIEAQKALAASAPTNPNAVAMPNTTAVGAPVVAGPKLSMDTIGAGGMSVDVWIKPTEHGLLFGDNKTICHKVRVSLDMVDGRGFMPKMGIKGGNPAQYRYSYDGVTCAQGGSWEAGQNAMRQLDPKAREYRCVDLPFRIEGDHNSAAVGPDGKSIVHTLIAKDGMMAGYSTSTTNWSAWQKFYDECKDKGLLGRRVLLEIDAEYRTNKNGNVWGTMTFHLIGDYEAEMAGSDTPE